MRMQYRASTGDSSFMAAQAGGAVPLFLRLSRRGNTFTAERSPDLTEWQVFSIITIPMPADLLAGIAVTSHDTSTVAAARFVDPIVSR